MSLHLRALGRPKLTDNDRPLELPPSWALLILGFIANHDEGVSRAELASTFWPDMGEKEARHNLSQFLYRYRGAPWATGLEATQQRINWTGTSDVAEFWRAIADGDWARAAGLHAGEFLESLEADRSAGASNWLAETRAELARAHRDATQRHAAHLADEGRHGEALDQLRSILQRDELAEDALQGYLRSAAATGRRADGLEQYEKFRKRLEEELGAEPLAATQTLAQALTAARAGAETPAAQQPDKRRAAQPLADPDHSVHQTPFVGRDIELTELANTLHRPGSRLVTITGSGGAGKSRVARRLAAEQAEYFAGGAHFVPLAALTSHEFLASAIAATLGMERASDALVQRLKTRLSEQPTLLVLDNFEHVLEGAGLVNELLTATPSLRVVTTSREPLELSYEEVYDLGGLSVPSDDQGELNMAYDAVQLLLASARRANSSFMLTEEQKPAFLQLCRLLGGLPLGLELAGAWLRLLEPQDLARELAADMDLLETKELDRPTRHRSLGVVFEHSWQQLTDVEQRALARLSLFRGGFDTDAARAVSLAQLRTLLALVAKSLLVRTSSGRFELLEPVRQYAERKLAAQPEDERRARERHAEHYLQLAEEAEGALKGPGQVAWLDRLALERDNFRVALNTARAELDAETGLRLVNALQQYWWVRGPYDEGPAHTAAFLAQPAAEPLPALRAKALHRMATLVQLQGDTDQARSGYQQALELSREVGARQTEADCLSSLGSLDSMQGDPASAYARFEAAAVLQRELDDRWGLSVTLNNMGLSLFFKGEYRAAIPLLQECLELKVDLEDPQGIAYALNNLGTVRLFAGDIGAARELTTASLELKESLGDHQGMATSLANLGRIAADEGDYDTARQQLRSAVQSVAVLDNPITLLWVVTAQVKFEALAGNFDRAVRLAGGCQALAENLGVKVLPASNEMELSDGLDLARLVLAPERVEALLSEGRELPASDLAALALGQAGNGVTPG